MAGIRSTDFEVPNNNEVVKVADWLCVVFNASVIQGEELKASQKNHQYKAVLCFCTGCRHQ